MTHSRRLFITWATFILFCIALVYLLNPFHFWMPNMLHIFLLAGLMGTFALLHLFVFIHNTGDEREVLHANFAGRIALLCGGSIAVIAITIQSFSHTIDPWLCVVLLALIAGQLGGYLFAQKYR